MSWINMKSRRSFNFSAPYNEEGERVVTIPFPVAVKRQVEGNVVIHDANPVLTSVSPASATAIDVETKVQAGSVLIVKNTGSAAATLKGVACAAGKVTTLLYDGNAYVSIGASAIV